MTITSDRQSAINWAKEMMERGFVVCDTETTGFHHDDEVIEIAAVNVNGAVLFNKRVKPSKHIPLDATKVHGIRDEDVANCPTFANVYTELYDVLCGGHIVCYNADFDLRLINQTCKRFKLPALPEWNLATSHCAMLEFAQFYGEWNSYRGDYRWKKLDEACSHFDINLTDSHSALGDCLRTLAVIKAMAETVE